MRGMKECCVACKEGLLCELCMRGMKECCVACKEGWLCELCMRGMKVAVWSVKKDNCASCV